MFLGLHDAGDKRGATNRSVDRVVLHPNFQPDSYDNDVALLRLSQGAELHELVQPVCLPRLRPQVRAAGRRSRRGGEEQRGPGTRPLTPALSFRTPGARLRPTRWGWWQVGASPARTAPPPRTRR